ncbi:MAG: glutathione S-transferase [Ponticaulis sp.]|nr:glutathione S-transferase [Ponticaulis sp.]
MKLIGMMDSPFVRRVAITLKLFDMPFEHEPVSVMRDFDTFKTYNPLVKAPSLIMDDGTVLMESSLILDVIEKLAGPETSLMPTGVADYIRAQRLIGLALIAAEKTVQKVYEFNMRSGDVPNANWLARVETQLAQAYGAIEDELAGIEGWSCGDQLTQADITTAVVWRFTEHVFPENAAADDYPRLKALSERAEALPVFVNSPLV